jgi:hypothetical protein
MSASPTDRVGLLIVRVWLQEPDGHLVARITQTLDLAGQRPRVAVVASSEEVSAAVRAWLGAFVVGADAPDDAPLTD